MSTAIANAKGLWNFIANKSNSDAGAKRRKVAAFSVPDEENIDKRKAALQKNKETVELNVLVAKTSANTSSQ